nr:MAG TPA: hypothetical protein [Caudoviricetes sp.]
MLLVLCKQGLHCWNIQPVYIFYFAVGLTSAIVKDIIKQGLQSFDCPLLLFYPLIS